MCCTSNRCLSRCPILLFTVLPLELDKLNSLFLNIRPDGRQGTIVHNSTLEKLEVITTTRTKFYFTDMDELYEHEYKSESIIDAVES
jgi:hypothetical protein